MDINLLKGVYVGLDVTNKAEVVFVPYKKRQNHNMLIMAQPGTGMGFMVKQLILNELSREENKSKSLVIIDPQAR